jgi:excisionase family DNA binding protein
MRSAFETLDQLVSSSADIPSEEVPRVLGKLQELKEVLRLRLRASPPATGVLAGDLTQALRELVRTPSLAPDPGKKPRRDKRLLTIPEAAEELSVRPTTLRAWLYQRRLPHVRLGRRVAVPREAIDKFIEEGLVPARDWTRTTRW